MDRKSRKIEISIMNGKKREKKIGFSTKKYAKKSILSKTGEIHFLVKCKKLVSVKKLMKFGENIFLR